MEGALVLVDPPGGLESGDFKRHRPVDFHSPAWAGALMTVLRPTNAASQGDANQCAAVAPGDAIFDEADSFCARNLISFLIKLCRVCPDAATYTLLS